MAAGLGKSKQVRKSWSTGPILYKLSQNLSFTTLCLESLLLLLLFHLLAHSFFPEALRLVSRSPLFYLLVNEQCFAEDEAYWKLRTLTVESIRRKRVEGSIRNKHEHGPSNETQIPTWTPEPKRCNSTNDTPGLSPNHLNPLTRRGKFRKSSWKQNCREVLGSF